MKDKKYSISFLVGDLPTYRLILELKTENMNKFLNIIPMTGAFHQQISNIYGFIKVLWVLVYLMYWSQPM